MSGIESVAPPISVVMSCYNAECWLAESIESVLNQTWRDFEFIIVDDGSTDGTGRIIEHFATNDARIVPITKPNTGLADSLNTGIARARGGWIARLDADDLCEPDRLAKQWRAASANPALVFVGTGLVWIDEHGKRLAVHRYPTSHRKLVAHLTTARKFPAHSSAFFRADAFRRVGGYRPRIRRAEDWDLWLRLSEVGELVSIRDALVKFRRHVSQISYEDGGLRSNTDARVALVSYWIRKAGHPDPVDLDAEVYDQYRAWVIEKLESDNLFERQAFRRKLRHAATITPASQAFFQLIFLVLSKPRLFLLLGFEKLTGSNLAQHLAVQWIASCRDNS